MSQLGPRNQQNKNLTKKILICLTWIFLIHLVANQFQLYPRKTHQLMDTSMEMGMTTKRNTENTRRSRDMLTNLKSLRSWNKRRMMMKSTDQRRFMYDRKTP